MTEMIIECKPLSEFGTGNDTAEFGLAEWTWIVERTRLLIIQRAVGFVAHWPPNRAAQCQRQGILDESSSSGRVKRLRGQLQNLQSNTKKPRDFHHAVPVNPCHWPRIDSGTTIRELQPVGQVEPVRQVLRTLHAAATPVQKLRSLPERRCHNRPRSLRWL